MQERGSCLVVPVKIVRMIKLLKCVCFALVFSGLANSQVDVPKFTVDVRNAFIWGEDAPSGAISSVIRDPLTGAELHRLKHNGVEVTSRMGFEKLHPEDADVLIVYSSTIVNNTETELAVKAGGIAVDGHLVSSVSTESNSKGVKQRRPSCEKSVVDIRSLHCLGSGYLSSDAFFQSEGMSPTIVESQSSLTVSEIVRDPRHYPLLCSRGGCHPKGTIRYSIRVGGNEYLFAWEGASVTNCGK